MEIAADTARIFLPLVLPVCLWVIYTDLSAMRISNGAVGLLVIGFFGLGLWVLTGDVLAARAVQFAVVLLLCFGLFALNTMGAGDAKFIAAAAPYVHPGDLRLAIALFAAILLAAVAAHRMARHSALHRLAPHWQSWQSGKRFPMGFALGAGLAAYLVLGALFGR